MNQLKNKQNPINQQRATLADKQQYIIVNNILKYTVGVPRERG